MSADLTPENEPAAGPRVPRIGLLLQLAHKRAARRFSEALDPLGIEGRHYGVLLNLTLSGPLSQRRLIDRTRSDKSSMVRTVDDLEALGLAVRRPDPADRRAHAVDITPAGRRVFGEATEIAERTAASLLDCFDAAEAEAFCALLTRFVAADGDL